MPSPRPFAFLLSTLLAIPLSARVWPVSDAASLAAAQQQSAEGDTIELAGGGAPYRASVVLKSGQSLIGRNAPILVAGDDPAIVATAGSVTIEGITIDVAAKGDGVLLRDHHGAFLFRSGRITGRGSGTAIRIEGGQGDVSIEGVPIERTVGAALVIHKHGTGTIAFRNGSTIAVSGGKADAIVIEETAAKVSFADAVTIETNGARAFYARGVNALSISGTPSSLSSIDAAALEIRSAALDLTLTSISAARSANGFLDTGVILDRVTGRFSLTGTSAADSGGTIRGAKMRGVDIAHAAGISLKNLALIGDAGTNGVAAGRCAGADNLRCNAAIVLHDVENIQLDAIRIAGSGQYGISGNDVRASTFSRITFDRAGDELDEHAMHFQNLAGIVRFLECSVRAAATRGLFIENARGEATVSVEKCSYSESAAPNGGQAILAVASGDAKLILQIVDPSFTNLWTSAIQAMAGGSAKLDLSVRGGRFDRTGGIVVIGEEGAVVNATIRGNRLHASTAAPIATSLSGSSSGSMTSIIAENVVDGSRCGACDGIGVENRGTGTLHATILGNDVGNIDGPGIRAAAEKTGALEVKIAGNTLHDPAAATTPAPAAIRVQAGARPTDAAAVCAALKDNHIAGPWDARGAIQLVNRTASHLRLAGYAGKGNDVAAIGAFLRGRNAAATNVMLAQTPAENAVTGCEETP